MIGTTNWATRFAKFFRTRQDELASVLDAGACREGWVQGELYRAFSTVPGFSVGCERLCEPAKGTADLACTQDPLMIAELKVLGGSYQRKVITGGALEPVRAYQGRRVGSHDRAALRLGSWGLVPDYFRLLDSHGHRDWERLLVLVADVEDDDGSLLGQTLRTIEFEGTATEVRLRRGRVRIWSLGNVR